MKLPQRILSVLLSSIGFISIYLVLSSLTLLDSLKNLDHHEWDVAAHKLRAKHPNSNSRHNSSFDNNSNEFWRKILEENSKDKAPEKPVRGFIIPTNKSTLVVDSDNLIEIGVWGSGNIGKWWGQFTCGKGPGDDVRVVQTTDYERLSKSDALFLIHTSGVSWNQLRINRPRGQIWIYMSFESPRNSQNVDPWVLTNDINWTYTYRSDATFPSPYGGYYPRTNAIKESFNIAQNKSGLVCAMMSNCGSSWGRMGMVRQIAEYINTDIYGACGDKQCPKDNSCNAILSRYKFYLAFENSECWDYITEKFWHNALDNDIVPIVYGARPEDFEKIAPPYSYIHVKNFATIKNLTDYLHILDSDDSLYNQYFAWKRRWFIRGNVLADYYEPPITMCRIWKKVKEVKDGHSTVGKSDHVKSWLNSCNQS